MADDEILDINGKLIYDLRVTDLKKELDKRALSKSGNKKELVERLKAQMLLEKYRAQASADETDEDEAAPNLSLPENAPQNDAVSEYLAKRRQLLQEQSQVKRQWEEQSKSAEESGHDEVTSPKNDTPNNHSPGKRGMRLTRDGLAKLKPSPGAEKKDDSQQQQEDTIHENKSSQQCTASGEGSPEKKVSSPTKEDSNKEENVDVQPLVPTESAPKSPPSSAPVKTAGSSSPKSESPVKLPTNARSQSPAPVRAKSRSPSPMAVTPEKPKVKSRSPTPENSKEQSRSPSPVKEQSPSPAKEKSRSVFPVKDKTGSLSHSPIKARTPSPVLEKQSASSSSESDKEVSIKKKSKSNERGRGPIRSQRRPSSSSSESRSESSSSSRSMRSRSRSRSRSTSSLKKQVKEPVLSSRSRSRSPKAPLKKASEIVDTRKSGGDANSTEQKEEAMDTTISKEEIQEQNKKPDINGSGEPKATERIPVVRRRRWGSTRTTTTKAAIVVSTDSLKGLIPEIKPSALIQEPVLELAPPEEEEEKMDMEEEEEDAFKKDLKIQRTVTQEVNSAAVKVKEVTPVAPPPPVVPDNDDVRQVEVEEMPEPTASKNEESKESPKAIRKPRRTLDVTVAPDEPQPSRRSPSPARNPVSCIIHIRNLVRPYTLRQLKEVLGRTGTLVDNGFWIDNIKSHAYATFEAEDQAKSSRQALHGTRWPSSNPKLLRIEYATPDEVDYHKSGDVTPASIKRQVRQDVTAKPVVPPVEDPLRGLAAEGRSRKEDLRASRLEPMREWDRDKVRQSRSRSRERRESDRRRAEDRSRDKSREQEKKKRDRSKERKERKEKKEETEEAPAKLLDDLFCKTKATPCIYWLPLTEEQAMQRAQRIKSQEEERERRRKEILKKEEDLRRQRDKDREERMRHREGPPRRSPDRGRPGDRGPDKNRGRRSRSRSRPGRRR